MRCAIVVLPCVYLPISCYHFSAVRHIRCRFRTAAVYGASSFRAHTAGVIFQVRPFFFLNGQPFSYKIGFPPH